MDKVTLNNKKQKRLMVLNEVLAGRFTGHQAAQVLGLSLRQTRRLLAAYRQAGAAGLAHGNRGREPVNKIDPAVVTQVVRLAGQGNGGGNLLLEIEYQAHPQFEVDGRNILYTLPLPPWQAALGTAVSVPTLGGPVELKIPAGSDAGRKLRLRGRGLPGTPAGDQIVELEVQAPAPVDEAQRQAYRDLGRAFGE